MSHSREFWVIYLLVSTRFTLCNTSISFGRFTSCEVSILHALHVRHAAAHVHLCCAPTPEPHSISAAQWDNATAQNRAPVPCQQNKLCTRKYEKSRYCSTGQHCQENPTESVQNKSVTSAARIPAGMHITAANTPPHANSNTAHDYALAIFPVTSLSGVQK